MSGGDKDKNKDSGKNSHDFSDGGHGVYEVSNTVPRETKPKDSGDKDGKGRDED